MTYMFIIQVPHRLPFHRLKIKKLVPCEIANQIMSIFKERKSTGAVLHCNGKIPCLASLLYSGTEFKMKNQGIIKGLYNEALKRNYNMDEMVAIPIINDLESLDKLKEILHKYCGSNIIIIRNQGVFIWADDWQKCKAAAECIHQLMEISIEMEKFGINPYTTLTTTTHASTDVSDLSSISTLNDSSAAAHSKVVTQKSPVKKVKDNQIPNSINNVESIPSTSNSSSLGEKPKQKNINTPKTTPNTNKKTVEGDKTTAKAPNRRQQNQNNAVKQGRVTKRNGANKGGIINRRSAERQLDRRPKGGNRMGGPTQGPNRPLMGPPGPMMNPGGPLMGGPHGTFTGGPANNGPPMGGPPMGNGFGGPQGPMMEGPMGPRGPMGDNPMMQAQMRAAQHHAAKQHQRNNRGRVPRPGGSGQKRGDKKIKGGVKKTEEKNM